MEKLFKSHIYVTITYNNMPKGDKSSVHNNLEKIQSEINGKLAGNQARIIKLKT